MDRNAWNGAGISLAVLITETGYNYRGTGTDFWPRLENDIGVEISQSGRKSIQKLFESLHQRLGIARPHESDWSRAFNIIAWPIRNALAPIEIHRKLSAALATLASSGLQGVSNEDFERKLVSVANGLWSRRLSDWLSDSGLAVDLSRRLLTGKTDTSWIEPLAAARVERDIQMDGECSQALRRARQSLQAKTGSITLPPAKWEIALRSNGETTAVEQLLLRGPNVSIATLNTVLKQHDRSVSIDIGSGENSAVFIERFLQGEAIELKRPEAAFSNIPLCISGRSASEAEISTLLTPLKPTVAALFRWKPFGGLLPAIVKGDEIQMDETILLLSPSNKNSNPPPESLEISAPLGLTARIAPARDFRFEIAHVGAIIVDSLLVQFLSGTKLLGDGRIIGAREDTPLLVRASVDGVELTYDGNALPSLMEKGDIAVLKVRSKPTELEARRHGHVQCHLIESFSEEAAISLSCHMRPAEATLVEFLSGEIVLTITSPVSLAPIKAEISLLQDQSTLAELTLESVVVPGRISLSTSDFKAMRDTAFKAIGGSQDTGWKLSISLGGLGRFDFPLRRKRTQWTRVPDKLLWINEENVSAGPGFMASVAAPLPVADFAAPPNDQVLLWLAYFRNCSWYRTKKITTVPPSASSLSSRRRRVWRTPIGAISSSNSLSRHESVSPEMRLKTRPYGLKKSKRTRLKSLSGCLMISSSLKGKFHLIRMPALGEYHVKPAPTGGNISLGGKTMSNFSPRMRVNVAASDLFQAYWRKARNPPCLQPKDNPGRLLVACFGPVEPFELQLTA
jgi:hypothetical protein